MLILLYYVIIIHSDINEPCYMELGLNCRGTNYSHKRTESFQEAIGTLRTANKVAMFCWVWRKKSSTWDSSHLITWSSASCKGSPWQTSQVMQDFWVPETQCFCTHKNLYLPGFFSVFYIYLCLFHFCSKERVKLQTCPAPSSLCSDILGWFANKNSW